MKRFKHSKWAMGVIVLSFGCTAAMNAQKLGKYCNDRFGFCVSYPVHFEQDRPPMNGDGQRFHDADGFTMSASGINDHQATVQSELASQTKDFDQIIYRATDKNWFVLSGYKRTDILYLKTFVGSGSINHLYIEYPTSLKDRYDQLVKKISDSFRPGRLGVGG